MERSGARISRLKAQRGFVSEKPLSEGHNRGGKSKANPVVRGVLPQDRSFGVRSDWQGQLKGGRREQGRGEDSE